MREDIIDLNKKTEKRLNHVMASKVSYSGPYSMSYVITSYSIHYTKLYEFYKKVWKSSSGELTSPCRTTFKWKIGEIHDGGQCGLWMCFDSIEAWAYMPNYRSKYEQHVLELEAMP